MTKLRLENFLYFNALSFDKDCEKGLELGDLTILVGPNGAGLGAPTLAVQFYDFTFFYHYA